MSTPEQRSRAARVAIYTRLATEDRKEMTAAANRANRGRFERQVDPDGVLEPGERARRAEFARKAYFTQLAAKSAAARQKRKPSAA
ncbi:hypothetical protein [Amycolatopsis sp. CFH S0078]|uniref:hypothetical protein n=1 Tax=Amycolatopsis sp. CFH S0078 TaxID=1644108 RepID=UPI00106E3043|nr:hypothetical protein [Amycolatopsis sp. CFH S0078]